MLAAELVAMRLQKCDNSVTGLAVKISLDYNTNNTL